jgi:hypothetical protein
MRQIKWCNLHLNFPNRHLHLQENTRKTFFWKFKFMSPKLYNLPCRVQGKTAFQHYNSFNFHPPPFGVK